MKMSDLKTPPIPEAIIPEDTPPATPKDHRKRQVAIKAFVLLLVFTLGVGSGYFVGSRFRHTVVTDKNSISDDESMAMMHQINPPEGYEIAAVIGDIGPQLVAAGAISMPRFSSLYEQQKRPLTDEQVTILTKGTQANIEINPENAYFWLNFFWALGLTNENPILTEGAMVSRGMDKVGGYASTGGWTLGTRQAIELYSSRRIVELTAEQQARLAEVAGMVFRPCCNNPTDFPDCNHGMAMLGLLELMSAQNASVNQMYEAAKYVNAFWYPQQMLEVAFAIKATQNVDFVHANAQEVVSSQYSSASGFSSVHQWLVANGLLPHAPSSGGSC